MGPDRRALRIAIAIAILIAPGIAAAAPRRSFTVIVSPPGWKADAIRAALERDLIDDRLAFVPASCDGACTDPVLHAAGVELVVRAAVDDGALDWEITPLWSGAPARARGVLALGAGLDRAKLAAAIRDPIHRIVRARADDSGTGALDLPELGGVLAAIAILAALLALPFAIAIARGRGARRVLALPAVRGALLGVIAGGGAIVAIAAWGIDGPWLAAGGLAWGSLVVAALPFAWPPIVGLGRALHHELAGVLRAWIVAAFARTLALALLCAPVVATVWLVCAAAGVDPALRLALATPVALLVARQVVRGAVAVFAPGTGGEVAVYGDRDLARIVIPRPMLELALSPWGRPHDYAAPRISTLHWTMWNAGLVMATAPDAPVATREQRRPREVTSAEGDEDLAHEEETERVMIGEPPTLAGVIEPIALDPRTGYRPEEDPMWLDWDPVEEYDGTDAGDRDFLFGVIVHALGRAQRHELGAATIALALARRSQKIARAPRPQGLGDLHAYLAGAGPHLVQYLAWRLWQREDLLTARAYAPELASAARRATDLLARETSGDPRLRTRLAALGARVRGEPLPRPRWARVALALAITAAAAGVALAIVDAVRYHATYVDRMDRMEMTHGEK